MEELSSSVKFIACFILRLGDYFLGLTLALLEQPKVANQKCPGVFPKGDQKWPN